METTASSLSPLIGHLRTRSQFSPSDESAILTLPYAIRHFAPGQSIIREGDIATVCCILLSGFAMRSKIVGPGDRQILGLQVPGEIIDLQNSLLGIADHNVESLTASSIALVPIEAIKRIALERPGVTLALWRETLVDGSIAREWIANVGRRDSRQRIAHILCEFAIRLEADRLGDQCNYEFPMTQEQLADAVGLTPVHVNRTLRAFDAEGLIERTKRSLVIRDWKGLARAGDFRTIYLHLPVRALA